jgi:hypothetical protein
MNTYIRICAHIYSYICINNIHIFRICRPLYIYIFLNWLCVLYIGGKDSLVAWYIARTQNKEPVLTYVCDDEDEYDDSWRLKEIVRSIGTNVHLVKHVFKNPIFEQHARYVRLLWNQVNNVDTVRYCSVVFTLCSWLQYGNDEIYSNNIHNDKNHSKNNNNYNDIVNRSYLKPCCSNNNDDDDDNNNNNDDDNNHDDDNNDDDDDYYDDYNENDNKYNDNDNI